MADERYHQLAKVLDTLPNGFPATESGVEIKLLKKIFRPDDAALFCHLRLDFETAQQIAERKRLPLEGLEEHLTEMGNRGQIFAIEVGEVKLFKMVPWAFGIYEFQLPHMDRELAQMCEDYMKVFSRQFLKVKPQLMQVIPIEKEIPNTQQALNFEQVSSIIESSQSFMVMDCVCKKEQHLLDHGCDKPLEVCTAYAPIPGVFDNSATGRAISKEDAYSILNMAEEAGLVHLTWNVESGHFFICNCCGCCCNVLKNINNNLGSAADVINSHYYAAIDPEGCTACGTCQDERCQVGAIEETEDAYRIIRERCIGCGLCVSTCPTEAIRLVRKPPQEIVPPPKNEKEWYEKRGRDRGVDYSAFK